MTVPEIALTEPVGADGRPLIVLGHSLGTGPLIWENVVPLLVADYRVSLLTLPGHGVAPVPTQPFTMAELATAVAGAARLAARGTALLYAGVSIGGVLGLQLALDHGALFSGVACLASGAQMGSVEHWQTRAATVREQSTSVLIAPSSKNWFAPESVEREPVLVGRILHALQDTSAEGYARCAEALGGVQLRGALERIAVPVLAAYGEHDQVAPEELQNEIVAGVQRGVKARIGGVGHQPPAERPDATADALLEFFAGVVR